MVLFEDLNKRAEEFRSICQRHRDDFLALLGHELRNALAPVVPGVDVLLLPDISKSLRARVCESIKRSVRHMVRLVDDLLDVARVIRGEIVLREETIELSSLMNEVCEVVQPLMSERRHEFAVCPASDRVFIRGDRTRVEQIFINLLQNAAKYTDPGGNVWFSWKPSGQEVIVQVRDSGRGLEPTMLSRIFDPYFQVESLRERKSGLGIGLALVHRFVELHRGSIEAKSGGLGQGAEFLVRLPVLERMPGAEAADLGPGEPAACRVVIVDDQVEFTSHLCMLLEAHGHECYIAQEALEALEISEKVKPDLILLDIGLPGMDGYEVARQLRQRPGLEKTVLVAVSGYGSEQDHRRASKAGFSRYLMKPVDSKTLLTLLSEVK